MLNLATEKGSLLVENLMFTLEAGAFTAGWYEIVITDVTRGIKEEQKLPATRLDLRVFDSEAEA